MIFVVLLMGKNLPLNTRLERRVNEGKNTLIIEKIDNFRVFFFLAFNDLLVAQGLLLAGHDRWNVCQCELSGR